MKNKKIIYRPWWNSEKEEQWLNDLSQEGWAMVDMFLMRYVFESCEPGEYTYKIQLLERHAGTRDSRRYIDFVTETGTEFVDSWIRWVYFRRKASEGPIELHSDRASQLKYWQIVYKFWISLAVLELSIGAMNTFIGTMLSGSHRAPINLFLGIMLLILGVFFLGLARPVKQRIEALKSEMTLLE